MPDKKNEFVQAYADAVKRPGAETMLEWLERSGFFEAPASAGHHLNHPGGLAEHSVNVYYRLLEITERDELPGDLDTCETLGGDARETVAVLGLLHDVCKVGVYHPETKRRRNPETGLWEDYRGYTFRDPFPLGHGEKSLYIISRCMALTEEEALAIRWHMGAYDDAVRGGSRAMTEAMSRTPWVWRLQEADMCATWIDERGGAL